MKLTKILAVCGIGAMLATPAYCEGMEFIYNDTVINADAKIINDRTMISIDAFEALGITVENNDGKWSFSKYENVVEYDEKTELMSYGDVEFVSDVKPVITDDEKLVPLRATVENVGFVVGWDWYEEKVVLVDFKGYIEALKEEHPDFYKLLYIQAKPVGQGISKTNVSMNIEMPDEALSKVKLDLAGTAAVKDDKIQGGLVLEGLSIEGENIDYSLSDVTFDTIYDADEIAIYFKTNLVGKLKDSLPEEHKQAIDSVSEVFTENMWYKFSLKEYFENMLAEVPENEYLSEEISEMYKTIEDYRNNGINIFNVVAQMVEDGIYIDDIYAFENVKAVVDIFTLMIDNKLIEIEFDGDILKSIKIDVDKNKLKEFFINVYGPANGYEVTEEDIIEFDEYFSDEDIALELLMEFESENSGDIAIKFLIKTYGMTFELSADEIIDGNAVPDDIVIPEAAIDFIALMEMMLSAEIV